MLSDLDGGAISTKRTHLYEPSTFDFERYAAVYDHEHSLFAKSPQKQTGFKHDIVASCRNSFLGGDDDIARYAKDDGDALMNGLIELLKTGAY